jgi:murein DD-endopeptidase MepM/ murein hydrolase activator NlpD
MPLLRSKESVTLKSGHGDLFLSVPLLFAATDANPAYQIINAQLAPLIQQFRKTPFCLVENELVRQTVMPGTYDKSLNRRKGGADNIAFSLVAMTVSTVDDLPGALAAQLSLMYFNYKPFSKDFYYRADWEPTFSTSTALTDESTAQTYVQAYNKNAKFISNPKQSAAWKAFWQEGWKKSERLLLGDLTNNLSFTFKALDLSTGTPAEKPYTWQASDSIPVKVSVSFTNRIAKLPILNWTYATHQYLGGLNRTAQIACVGNYSSRAELERLKALIDQDMAQAANLRVYAKSHGILIQNDILRLCGFDQVMIEDLNLDTVPGHPDLIQVVINVREFFLPAEEMVSQKSTTAQLDGFYQSVLWQILQQAQDGGLLSYRQVSQSAPIEGLIGETAWNPTGSQTYVWERPAYTKNSVDRNTPMGQVLFSNWGRGTETLLSLLNSRPDKTVPYPQFPGQAYTGNTNTDAYYDKLRSVLDGIINNSPLAKMGDYQQARAEIFKAKGNLGINTCYPDLQLPQHPVTGRIQDTEPDCYFYNRSDSKPLNLEDVKTKAIEVARQAYSSAGAMISNKGGLGFDTESGTPNSGASSGSTTAPTPLSRSTASTQMSATAQQKVQAAMAYLTSKGWQSWQAAALIGNALWESGGEIDPTVVQKDKNGNPVSGGGVGIIQWDPTRLSAGQQWASNNNLNWNDTQTQFAFANYELTSGTEQAAGAALRATTNTTDANRVVLTQYERAKTTASEVNRLNYTNQVLNTAASNPALAPSANAVAATNPNMIFPVTGQYTSGIGADRGNHTHQGNDYTVDKAGTVQFVAPANGQVTINKWGRGNSGWEIFFKQDDGYTWFFCHLDSKSPISVNTPVTQGTPLGLVGNSGTQNSSPHLHTELRDPQGNLVDPAKVFNLTKGQMVQVGQTATGSIVPVSKTASVQATLPNGQTASYASSTGCNFYEHPFDQDTNNSSISQVKLGHDELFPMTTPTDGKSYSGHILKENVQDIPYNPSNSKGMDFNANGVANLFSQVINSQLDYTLTMRRAYPTFVLSFRDEFRDNIFTFYSNSYDWGAVKEIRLVRSRKNPVDTLVVEMSNARGNLFTQQFNSGDAAVDDKASLDFNKSVIKEGTAVSLKLGYSNNPANLDVVFNGKITEIEGHNSAVVTIVCQSYAIELFQKEIGADPNKAMGWFHSDTRELLSILLVQPELAHFGRWQPQIHGKLVQNNEGDSSRSSAWRTLFNFLPNPADNNIFAPDYSALNGISHWWNTTGAPNSIQDFIPYKWLRYVPYRQTPWEIIEEMTLRHPGYIASVVPYDNRVTLFFGVPCQNYRTRRPSSSESRILSADSTSLPSYDPSDLNAYINRPSTAQGIVTDARMKPFRNYYYIDSQHHLVDNGMITTSRDTFNAVEVEYVENAETAFLNTNQDNLPDPSSFYTKGVFKVKANSAIREDFCRWFHTRERNCEGDLYAKKYASGYLFKFLKDFYTGEIVLAGEPGLKPYDTIFLHDSYNDLFGPVEVEQVTHIFSSEAGFISVVTPDLVVTNNEYATASIMDALSMYFAATWIGYHKSDFGSGKYDSSDMADVIINQSGSSQVGTPVSDKILTAAGALTTIAPILLGASGWGLGASAIFAFCGLCFFNWAREQNPMRITPVVWRGRPFICGLDGFPLDNAWGHAGTGARRTFTGISQFATMGADYFRSFLNQPY